MRKARQGAKFYAVHYQSGEGCDYTIGCGLRVVALDAATRDEAELEVAEDLGANDGDDAREAVLIIEAASSWAFDVAGHTARMRDAQRQIEERVNEQAEHEQFEKLRKKFG